MSLSRAAAIAVCLLWTVGGVAPLASCGGTGGAKAGAGVRGDGGAISPLDASGVDGAVSLAIAPAGLALEVTDLSALPSAQLTARATYADGTTHAVSASWTLDRIDIATIGAGTGSVSAAGNAFGTAVVTAVSAGLSATSNVTVSLKASVMATPVTADTARALSAATAPDPSVTAFAYPYDQTVFPSGLLPPEIMWNGGQAGDDYLVHVVGPSFDLSYFTTADPPSRATLDASLWNALATSAAGAKATVSLARFSGGTAYASAHETWAFARANLHGFIYYWSIADGEIVKLDLTTGARHPAFDPGSALSLGAPAPLDAGAPGSPPWEDALPAHQRCVACHAVSKDGTTISSVFSRGDSTGPFGTIDVASGTVTEIGDYGVSGAFAALTPDARYAALNDNAMTMSLADTATGALIPSVLDGLQNLCDPVFSPDGTKFALATRCGEDDPLAYPVQYTTSDLSLYDFTVSPAPAFSNARTLLGGGATDAGTGSALAFPSFSPDSQWIFFQRGDNSRAKIDVAAPYAHGRDDLYVTRTEAGAAPLALDRANGVGALADDNLHLNYAPTVNPIAEGGYIWVVFTSPRDYGNRIGAGRIAGSTTYPSDATYANPKQLWVTAVDANIGSTDPSHPAFWLPGQDDTTINMFGYWALAPCRTTLVEGGSSACTAGFECCSGFCRGGVCVDPPSGCHQLDERCAASSECCNGFPCTAGVCQAAAPR